MAKTKARQAVQEQRQVDPLAAPIEVEPSPTAAPGLATLIAEAPPADAAAVPARPPARLTCLDFVDRREETNLDPNVVWKLPRDGCLIVAHLVVPDKRSELLAQGVAAKKATEQAMEAAREAFRSHPSFVKFAALEARQVEAKARLQQAEQAAAESLAEAQRLLAEGQDPTVPEGAYREALTSKVLAENRLASVGPVLRTIRTEAENQFQQTMADTRKRLWSEAAAEKAALVDALAAAVLPLLPRLQAAGACCELLSPGARNQVGMLNFDFRFWELPERRPGDGQNPLDGGGTR